MVIAHLVKNPAEGPSTAEIINVPPFVTEDLVILAMKRMMFPVDAERQKLQCLVDAKLKRNLQSATSYVCKCRFNMMNQVNLEFKTNYFLLQDTTRLSS